MVMTTTAGDVMMQLGALQFSVNTAAYQELTRTSERKWSALPQFGKLDALQDTGPGDNKISLRGVVFPEYRGGWGQVASLRELMDQAVPQLMVDGLGNVMGMWVVERVEEVQDTFAMAGQPLRQAFTVELRKFSDVVPASAAGGSLVDIASSATAAVPAALDNALAASAAVGAGIASAATAATAMSGSLTASLGTLGGLGDLGAFASSAAGAVSRCLDVTKSLQGACSGASSLLSSPPSLSSARGAAASLLAGAGALGLVPSTASNALGSAIAGLSGIASGTTMDALRNAQEKAQRTEAMVRDAAGTAESLLNKIPVEG